MGKQYISTNTAANAHAADILDVAIASKYTVTVSGDGYAKFWDNKQDEVHDPLEHVVSHFISASGVHHVNIYENVLSNSGIKVVVIVYGCFDGRWKLQYYVDDDISSLQNINPPPAGDIWNAVFFKDPQSREDVLIAASVKGDITTYAMEFAVVDKKIADVTFEEIKSINTEGSFPNSMDISSDKKLAVGHTNGDVLLYEVNTLKPIYTFHSTDLVVSKKDKFSNSIPRVVKFAPGGALLAVARDNQNAGSITLYDVHYGENVGMLTKSSHSSKTTIGGFAHDGWIMGLSFDDDGLFLASCGFDKKVRVWNLDNHEREATISLSASDFDNAKETEMDTSVASGVSFIKKGVRGGLGGDSNAGLCVISFDRGVRWYREAGGI